EPRYRLGPSRYHLLLGCLDQLFAPSCAGPTVLSSMQSHQLDDALGLLRNQGPMRSRKSIQHSQWWQLLCLPRRYL
ncbi:MAG TPA: hypothetical protein PKX17_05710, partial [Candidatus Methanomethylicus sp.]|nr:hypothetical protein [Candidatus Methanomethylicus sp.]